MANPSDDPASLLERLRAHLDRTGGAVVISASGQSDYLAASEWGDNAGSSYGMGATPMRALHDMLTGAGS